VRSNLADIRWKGHEKYIRRAIRFRPKYARLIDRLCTERESNQREVIEAALKGFFGEPEE
jgi:hypothetical protein